MRSLTVYYSFHHYNTEKIALKIAHSLSGNVISLKESDINTIEGYDLVGFGSGIYFGKFHPALLTFIKRLPDAEGKPAFIFSTSGIPDLLLINRFSNPFKELLIRKGFQVVGEFNCLGFDSNGLLRFIVGINRDRPNETDLKKAGLFANNLISAWNKNPHPEPQ